ncbi:MAG: dipeptidase PepE [Gammaproteobacteria bacterium]|nr:dipeptidase PepE [Gammaproteobacteria bacterium]
MNKRNLLLLSSSRSATTGFLEACDAEIRETLGTIKRAVFIGYAVVGDESHARLHMVDQRLAEFGVSLEHITVSADPVAAIESAEAVLVSGGNTYCLLDGLYRNAVLDPLRRRIAEGMPYIGWSAGSNVAGATICTTNDMPIIQPPSFRAIGAVPFQLNPHFTDAMPPGHRGETREDRLREYLALHRDGRVVGIAEGGALRVQGDSMRLCGEHDGWLFRHGEPRIRLAAGKDISYLLD